MKTGKHRDQNPPHAHHHQSVSRRDVLKTAGVAVGTVVASGMGEAAQSDDPVSLTETEYNNLDAICSRIIPADQSGPGAREARAVRFIDRGLGGALRASLGQYRAGLAALDTYCNSSRGADFTELSETDQDAVLAEMQDNEAPGFGDNSAQFFNLVRGHTIQGTFSDPFYGGNADFVGWDMIGYPGVRIAVAARYQQAGEDHAPNHSSVYEFTMFDEGEV
jgi:gluconate 2-dehydrogenase gamma chain